jgi:hypothetical protein
VTLCTASSVANNCGKNSSWPQAIHSPTKLGIKCVLAMPVHHNFILIAQQTSGCNSLVIASSAALLTGKWSCLHTRREGNLCPFAAALYQKRPHSTNRGQSITDFHVNGAGSRSQHHFRPSSHHTIPIRHDTRFDIQQHSRLPQFTRSTNHIQASQAALLHSMRQSIWQRQRSLCPPLQKLISRSTRQDFVSGMQSTFQQRPSAT